MAVRLKRKAGARLRRAISLRGMDDCGRLVNVFRIWGG